MYRPIHCILWGCGSYAFYVIGLGWNVRGDAFAITLLVFFVVDSAAILVTNIVTRRKWYEY